MSQDLGDRRFLQSFSLESFTHLRRADLAPEPARDDGDHQKFTASREMGRGPHLSERSRQYRADRRTRVGFHEPAVGIGRHGVEHGGLPAITISFNDQTEQGPEQPHVKVIGHALDRIRRDRGDRMGAVVEIRQCRRERDFFHLLEPQARTTQSLTGSPRSCGTRARLASPEGDSRHGPRRQIGPPQVLFHALDTRPGHSLSPQQSPDSGIAETARVLLADDQHDQIRYGLIEVHEQPVLGMHIDHCSRHPRDRREVSDHRVGNPLPSPRVGL